MSQTPPSAATPASASALSVGTNAAHGLPRTNADKRHAVLLLLKDEEWGQWSSHEIARRCAVSHTFVDNARRSLATVASDEPTKTYTNRHGQTATMNTENIGRSEGQKRPTAPNYKPREQHVREIESLAASVHCSRRRG